MPTKLTRGAYSQECPFEAEQLQYWAGGHPGCGGYLEVLRLKPEHYDRWFVQQYTDDIDGQRYRYREFFSREEALDAIERIWPRVQALEGVKERPIPVWEYLAKECECHKCGKPTLLGGAPDGDAICPECCEHDYQHDPNERTHVCQNCGEFASDEWVSNYYAD